MADSATRRGLLRKAAAGCGVRKKRTVSLPRLIHSSNKDSAVGLAEIASARHRFAEARRRSPTCTDCIPKTWAFSVWRRDFQLYDRWRLEVSYAPQYSEGPQTQGLANTVVADLTSPLLKDAWQVFTQFRWADAHAPEGLAELKRTTLGSRLWFHDGQADVGVTWNVFGAPGTRRVRQRRLAYHRSLGGVRESRTGERRHAATGAVARYYVRQAATRRALAFPRIARDCRQPLRWRDLATITCAARSRCGLTQRLVDMPHFDVLGGIEAAGIDQLGT